VIQIFAVRTDTGRRAAAPIVSIVDGAHVLPQVSLLRANTLETGWTWTGPAIGTSSSQQRVSAISSTRAYLGARVRFEAGGTPNCCDESAPARSI
jgi:hypothetical protein